MQLKKQKCCSKLFQHVQELTASQSLRQRVVGVLTETHIWKRYWHLKYFRLQETAVLRWPCNPGLCQMIF